MACSLPGLPAQWGCIIRFTRRFLITSLSNQGILTGRYPPRYLSGVMAYKSIRSVTEGEPQVAIQILSRDSYK